MHCISWDDFRSSNVRFLEKALTGKDPVYVRRTDDILLQIVPIDVAIETDEQLEEITNEWSVPNGSPSPKAVVVIRAFGYIVR